MREPVEAVGEAELARQGAMESGRLGQFFRPQRKPGPKPEGPASPTAPDEPNDPWHH